MYVVTPIPLVLRGLCDLIRERYPRITFQYDPNLTFTDAITGLRSIRSSRKVSNSAVFPLYTLNRSNLRPSEMGRRLHLSARIEQGGINAEKLQFRWVDFDVAWRLYVSDVVVYDTFEVQYMTQTSFNDRKELTIEVPFVGKSIYGLTWGDLDGIEYSGEDNLFISVGGTVTVTGPVMTLQEIPEGTIREINLRIKEFHGTLLDSMSWQE